MKRRLLLLLPLIAIVGCTTASVQTSDGVNLSYRNFFFQKQIGKFAMGPGGSVQLEGVQSEAATLVKAVSEGVATGLTKAVVP